MTALELISTVPTFLVLFLVVCNDYKDTSMYVRTPLREGTHKKHKQNKLPHTYSDKGLPGTCHPQPQPPPPTRHPTTDEATTHTQHQV